LNAGEAPGLRSRPSRRCRGCYDEVGSRFGGAGFSLDEPKSPQPPWLRRLTRGWKAAPTGLEKKQLH